MKLISYLLIPTIITTYTTPVTPTIMRYEMSENEKNPPTERTRYESTPPMMTEMIYDTMNIVARVPVSDVRIPAGSAPKSP